jgi:hypothetical protein
MIIFDANGQMITPEFARRVFFDYKEIPLDAKFAVGVNQYISIARCYTTVLMVDSPEAKAIKAAGPFPHGGKMTLATRLVVEDNSVPDDEIKILDKENNVIGKIVHLGKTEIDVCE